MNWKSEYDRKVRTAGEAVRLVGSGDKLYVGTCSSVAFELMRALWERRGELHDVEILSSNIISPSPVFVSSREPFQLHALFYGTGGEKGRNNGFHSLYLILT
jgi:4-hydroxybutyrate CoA-transferase